MKRIFAISLFVGLLPQITLAAWWNPSTWFEKNVQVRESATSTTTILPADTNPPLKEKAKPSAPLNKPQVVEKIVPQIITVDNPELQAKIDLLVKENAELNARVNDYISRLNQCTDQSTSKPTVLNPDQIRDEKLSDIDEQILAKINRYLAWTPGTTFNNGTNSMGLITAINELLDAYRVVDSRMTYKNIPLNTDFAKGRPYIVDLKNYLVNSYIKYR